MVTFKYEGKDCPYARLLFLMFELKEITGILYSSDQIVTDIDFINNKIEIEIDEYIGCGKTFELAVKSLIADYEEKNVENYVKLCEKDIVEDAVNRYLDNREQ